MAFTNIIILKKNNGFFSASNYFFLVDFYYDLDKFSVLEPQDENWKVKKMNRYDTASEFSNEMLGFYFGKNYDFSNAQRKEIDIK